MAVDDLLIGVAVVFLRELDTECQMTSTYLHEAEPNLKFTSVADHAVLQGDPNSSLDSTSVWAWHIKIRQISLKPCD